MFVERLVHTTTRVNLPELLTNVESRRVLIGLILVCNILNETLKYFEKTNIWGDYRVKIIQIRWDKNDEYWSFLFNLNQ